MGLISLWQEIRQQRRKAAQEEQKRRRLWANRLRPVVEVLEERMAPSVSTSYVDDNWQDVSRNSGPAQLGDSIANLHDTINPGGITATYGTDGFGTVLVGSTPYTVSGAALINNAISNTNSSGTVNVLEGTYNEHINPDKAITLLGAQHGVDARNGRPGAAESILSLSTYGLEPTADHVTVDGFTIVKSASGNPNGLIETYANANYFTLDNTIVNDSARAVTGAAILFGGGSHTNLVFSQNLFQDQGDATILLGGPSSTDVYDNLLIESNKFLGNSGGVFQTTNNPFVNAVIRGNEFDGTVGGVPGIGDPLLNIGKGGNISIADNYFHDMDYTAFQVGVVGGSITGNTFSNIYADPGVGFGDVFQLWGGEYGTSVSTNVTIANNLINYNDVTGATNPTRGIRLRPPTSGPGIDGTTIHIHDNSFVNGGVLSNVPAIIDQGDPTKAVDASGNWWDTSLGSSPSTTTDAQLSQIAALMVGPVHVGSFLNSGSNTATVGFTPAATTEMWVPRTAATTGLAVVDGNIQDGVDTAVPGMIVRVAADTYDENVTIGKSLSLVGAGSGSTIIQVGGGVGVSLSGSANTITLQGLSITGGSSAIDSTGLTTLNLTDVNSSGNTSGGTFTGTTTTVNLMGVAGSTISADALAQTFSTSSLQAINYGGNSLANLNLLTLGNGNSFNVKPATGQTTAIMVNGGLPFPPGSTLDLDLSAVSNPFIASSGPGSGSLSTTPSANPVSWTNISNVLAGIALTPGDSYRVFRSGTGGADLEVDDVTTATPVFDAPYSTVTALTLNGTGAGGNLVNVDFIGGTNPIPSGGIFFNGAGTGNSLKISNGSFTTVTSTYTGPHSGNISFDSLGTVSYTGLQPIDMTGSTAANMVIHLPSGDGNNQAILEDNGNTLDNTSQIRSQNGTFETTQFTNPTTSLVVDASNDGETLTVAKMDPGINSTTNGITFNGGPNPGTTDTLVGDFSSGVNIIPVGGIHFAATGNGGIHFLPGYTATNITDNYSNASSGNIHVDAGVLTYSGLSQSRGILDQLAASTRNFNFSSTISNNITLGDDPTANNGISRIASLASSPTTDFQNPTTSVTVNAGNLGDTITAGPLDATNPTPTVNLNGGSGNDTFNVIPNAALAYNVNGMAPTSAGAGIPPGDTLNLDTSGITNPVLAITGVNGASKTGTYTFRNAQNVNFQDIETLTPTVTAATTVTVNVSPVSVPTSASGTPVTVSANVSSGTVNVGEGSVTFALFNSSGVQVGAASSPVSVSGGGTGNVLFTIPANTPVGSYSIRAVYSDNNSNAVFSSSTGQTSFNVTTAVGSLTINSVNPITASTANQNVSVSASVSDGSGIPVNSGQVTFTLTNVNGTAVAGFTPVAVAVNNGVAQTTAGNPFVVPGDTGVGSYLITATYSGGTFTPASAQTTLVVNAAPTTTTINGPAASFAFSTTNRTVPVLATVVSNGVTVPANEGHVTYTLYDNNNNPVSTPVTALVGTAANLTIPGGTAAGGYHILAQYTDDVNHVFANSSGTQALTIVNTTATLGISPATTVITASTSAQNVPVTATLKDLSGNPISGGTVSFSLTDVHGNAVAGFTPPAPVNVVNGTTGSVSLSIPGNTGFGNYTITATYTPAVGGVPYITVPATSTLTINAATTSVSASVNPATIAASNNTAQTVNVSATVTSNQNPVGEGSVIFSLVGSGGQVGVSSSAISVAPGAGTASTTLSVPAGTVAGSYQVVASYSDAQNVFASNIGTAQLAITSGVGTLTLNPVTPVTASTSDQNVSVSAVVLGPTGSGPVNTGTVTFTLTATAGGSPLASVTATPSEGTAATTLSIPGGTAAGSYILTASYTGVSFDPPNATQTLLVNTAASTTTLTSTPSIGFSATSSGSVQVSATVQATGGGAPNGHLTYTLYNSYNDQVGQSVTVAVTNGTTPSGTLLSVPSGTPVGAYHITASFTDDVNHIFATSSSTQAFTILSTSATLSLGSVTPITASPTSQNVPVTATLEDANGNPISGGTVTFALTDSHGNAVAGFVAPPPATVTAGTTGAVTLTLPGEMRAGSYTITATYTPAGFPYVVVPATTALTVNAAPTMIVVNSVSPITANSLAQPATVTATVTSNDQPVSQGVVTFTLVGSAGQIGQSVTVAASGGNNGVVSATLTVPGGTPSGSYGVRASYHDNQGVYADSNSGSNSSGGIQLIVNAQTPQNPLWALYVDAAWIVLDLNGYGPVLDLPSVIDLMDNISYNLPYAGIWGLPVLAAGANAGQQIVDTQSNS